MASHSPSLGKVSPIDDEDYHPIFNERRVPDEGSQAGESAKEESRPKDRQAAKSVEEGFQASSETSRLEDHFEGIWKEIVTQTDREHCLMLNIIELHDLATDVSFLLKKAITPLTPTTPSMITHRSTAETAPESALQKMESEVKKALTRVEVMEKVKEAVEYVTDTYIKWSLKSVVERVKAGFKEKPVEYEMVSESSLAAHNG